MPMDNVRIQTIGSLLFLTAAILLLTASASRAITFQATGVNGTGVTDSVEVSYNATSATKATITLMVTNTTPLPPANGAITGLALHLPGSVTGLTDFTFSSDDRGAKKFNAFLLPDGVDAGPLGLRPGVTNAKVTAAAVPTAP